MQKAILAASKEATEHSFNFLQATEQKIRNELEAKGGMVFTDPANDEKEWIEKVTTAVWPKFYTSIGGKKKLDEALTVLGR